MSERKSATASGSEAARDGGGGVSSLGHASRAVASMVNEGDHGEWVNAWMEREVKGVPPERLLSAFEEVFAALWQRAHVTLGDVTLTAIIDRVLHVASELHPSLASLAVDASGLRCDDLRQRAGSLEGRELEEGVRFVLVEFLTVLGNLTDEILTPALHSELSGGGQGAES